MYNLHLVFCYDGSLEISETTQVTDDSQALLLVFAGVLLLLLRTQEICFGRKTNEIAKFGILDKNRNSQFWTKFLINWRYHSAFTVGLKERVARIIGMRMD